MKTKSILLFLVIINGILFNACKKGENDPSLSLKSRTARLNGEWKLISGEITTTTDTNTTVETYDGATVVTTYNGTQVSNVVYTDNITFDKNGTYTRSWTSDTASYTENGYWAWMNKNKEADIKNKEALGMSATKFTDSNGSVSSNAGFFVAGIWMLDELSSTKMVVIVDGSSTTDNVTSKKQGSYSYEKQ